MTDYKALASARVKAGGAYGVKRFLGQIGQARRQYAARNLEMVKPKEIRAMVGELLSAWDTMIGQTPSILQTDTGPHIRANLQRLGMGQGKDKPAKLLSWSLGEIQEDVKTALSQAYATGGVRSKAAKDTFNATAALDELTAIDAVIDQLATRLVTIKKQAFAAGVGGVVQSMNKAHVSLYDAGIEITAARVAIRQHLTKRGQQ